MGIIKHLSSWLAPITHPMALAPALETDTLMREDVTHLLKRLEWQWIRRLRKGGLGDHRTAFLGKGLDFHHLREYVPGDEIRKIDWNVFARTFSPHIKEYQEEHQLQCWLVVDLTPSMYFGQHTLKAETALSIAGLLGLLSTQASHSLGLLAFSGDDQWMLPPRHGRVHVQHLMKRLLTLYRQQKDVVGKSGAQRFSNISVQLDRVIPKRSVVFILSDYLCQETGWEKALGKLSRHCNLFHLPIHDPVELSLPEGLGVIDVFDPETREMTAVNTEDPVFRHHYETVIAQRERDLFNLLGTWGHVYPVSTQADPVDVVFALSAMPARRIS